MKVYYNENDPQKVFWLKELMNDGVITPGEIDERSITDVQPADLVGFTRCHFFAGIGIWDYALIHAGWPVDREVWTGSCPCPPFSTAGKKKACSECGGTNPVPHVGRTGYFVCCLCGHAWFADARHLWPEMWRLKRDQRPPSFFGEQVASEDGRTWFASVRASLEILGYAARGFDLCAAGVGSPTIRQRLFFVADTVSERWREVRDHNSEYDRHISPAGGEVSGMANGEGERGKRSAGNVEEAKEKERLQNNGSKLNGSGEIGGLVDSNGQRCEVQRNGKPGKSKQSRAERSSDVRRLEHSIDSPRSRQRPNGWQILSGEEAERLGLAGLTSGFWSNVVWIPCNDPEGIKYRPIEPSTFPVAKRHPGRVCLLRGAGDAIVAPLAIAFVQSHLEEERELQKGIEIV